mmetsp:Transcript_49161/g.106752  ORF Transcript_49161/g.106752 Transcript_49161/m.106752 type:complete len:152 (-) Transcript_49161:71-526(-)
MQPPPSLDKEKRNSLLLGATQWPSSDLDEENGFDLDSEGASQMMERQQDASLDILHQSVLRIGAMGSSIHEELNLHSSLIEELGEEVETADSRVRHMRSEVERILKTSSTAPLVFYWAASSSHVFCRQRATVPRLRVVCRTPRVVHDFVPA